MNNLEYGYLMLNMCITYIMYHMMHSYNICPSHLLTPSYVQQEM